jgi:hypothetical protein
MSLCVCVCLIHTHTQSCSNSIGPWLLPGAERDRVIASRLRKSPATARSGYVLFFPFPSMCVCVCVGTAHLSLSSSSSSLYILNNLFFHLPKKEKKRKKIQPPFVFMCCLLATTMGHYYMIVWLFMGPCLFPEASPRTYTMQQQNAVWFPVLLDRFVF